MFEVQALHEQILVLIVEEETEKAIVSYNGPCLLICIHSEIVLVCTSYSINRK